MRQVAAARAYPTRPSFPRETTALLGPPFGFFFAFKSLSFFGAAFFETVDLDLDFVAMRKCSAIRAGEVNLRQHHTTPLGRADSAVADD